MSGLRRALIAVAATGFLLGALVAVLVGSADVADGPARWAVLTVLGGWGFVGAGVFAWLRRPDDRTGPLMVATGFAWYVAMLHFTDVPLLFTIGGLLSNLFAVAAIHLLLAFPSGRLQGGKDRVLVASSYLLGTIGFLPAMLFMSPAESGCAQCPENLMLISSEPGFATAWLEGLSVVAILLLGVVAARLLDRWRGASPPLRRVISPVYAPGGLLLTMLAVLLALGAVGAASDIHDAAYYATIVPFVAVPYAFVGGLARARMLRGGSVGRLVASLGSALGPGELREGIARALNDPSIELAYWLPDARRYVDESGQDVELPAAGGGRGCYEVRHDGAPVAAIIHDPSLLEDPALIEAVGAAAALALERERLDAELRAKVAELRDSRTRLLSSGLAERRRLERDLHDGAQQRLVSMALDLRLARQSVREDPEAAERLLGDASEQLAAALTELRDLARGIHPAVLSDRGLGPAVESLVRRLPLSVDVRADLDDRPPEQAEVAAYYVVTEALTNVVKYAHADSAAVVVERVNGGLAVEVSDDGVGGADPEQGSGLHGLADRLAALGGELELDSRQRSGTMVRARIPCE